VNDLEALDRVIALAAAHTTHDPLAMEVLLSEITDLDQALIHLAAAVAAINAVIAATDDPAQVLRRVLRSAAAHDGAGPA
jgi:hypothetical protein